MEQEKKKKNRVRGENEIQKGDFGNENAKRKGVTGVNMVKEEEEKEGCSSSSEPEAIGVFDFPWLKDGVTFKTEDYLFGFEDTFNFSSSLQKEHVAAAASNVDFCKEHGLLCETSMIHVPEAKLEDYNALWQQPIEGGTLKLKAEDVTFFMIFYYIITFWLLHN